MDAIQPAKLDNLPIQPRHGLLEYGQTLYGCYQNFPLNSLSSDSVRQIKQTVQTNKKFYNDTSFYMR